MLGELALDPDPDRAVEIFMALSVKAGDDAELAREIKAKLGR